MHVKNISHHSSLAPPWLSFLSSATPSISDWRVGEPSGTTPLAWPQDKRATMRRPERPSTRRWNGADGLVTDGPAWQARHEWLPADLAPSISRASDASLPRCTTVAGGPAATSAAGPLPPVNFTRRQVFIIASSKEMLRCVESACYKRIFQVFFICFRGMLQVLHTDVVKSRSGCCTYCIYCKCLRWMLHAFVQNISSISDVRWEYVPNVSSVFNLMLQQVFSCCKLQMFYLDVAFVAVTIQCMLQAYVLTVSDICCKCFIWMLHMLQWLYTYSLRP
jgi:hypothetical protein